jgi:hypothetical protein
VRLLVHRRYSGQMLNAHPGWALLGAQWRHPKESLGSKAYKVMACCLGI